MFMFYIWKHKTIGDIPNLEEPDYKIRAAGILELSMKLAVLNQADIFQIIRSDNHYLEVEVQVGFYENRKLETVIIYYEEIK